MQDMGRIYVPSKGEEKVIGDMLKKIAKDLGNRLGMKNPGAYCDYYYGIHFEKIHTGEEIKVIIDDSDGRAEVAYATIENGVFISYRYKKKIYKVAKLKDLVKACAVEKGYWEEEEKPVKHEVVISLKKEDSDIEDEEEPVEEDDYEADAYEDYLMRKAYCEQYRAMFGTESLFVSDNLDLIM